MVLTMVLGLTLLVALWRCAVLLHALRGGRSRRSRVPVPALRPYVGGYHAERCGIATCHAPVSHAIFVDDQAVPYEGYCVQHLRDAYLELIAEDPKRALRVRLVREARVPQPYAA